MLCRAEALRSFSEAGWCPLVDVIRTDFRQDVEALYSILPDEMKEWLAEAVETALVDMDRYRNKKKAA